MKVLIEDWVKLLNLYVYKLYKKLNVIESLKIKKKLSIFWKGKYSNIFSK